MGMFGRDGDNDFRPLSARQRWRVVALSLAMAVFLAWMVLEHPGGNPRRWVDWLRSPAPGASAPAPSAGASGAGAASAPPPCAVPTPGGACAGGKMDVMLLPAPAAGR